MKKSVFGTIIWILFCSSFAFAGVEDYVGEERANLLRKNGSIDLIHPSGENKLSMIPDCIYTEKINAGLMEKDAKGVPFTAEFLYLIPKSKLLEGSSKESINNDDISVLFRSITRMEGMRYHFSEKKGGEEPVSRETRTPFEDSVIPPEDSEASTVAYPSKSSAVNDLSSVRKTCAIVFSASSMTFPSENQTVASERFAVWIVSPLYTGEPCLSLSHTTRSRNFRCAVLYLNVIVAIGFSFSFVNARKKLL